MEYKELPLTIVVLLLLALIIGTGVLVFDNFSASVKGRDTVTNETLTIVSQAGSTANDDLVSISFVGNDTFEATNIARDVNHTAAGAIRLNDSFLNRNYNITYLYLGDVPASRSVDSMRTAVGTIGSTWFSLIITVMVLALIVGMVIKGFGSNQR